MARYRENFTLYARRRQNGEKVWCYRTYDRFGRRTAGISTGLSSKTKARAYCEELLKAGRLLQPRLPTLREWAEARRWWRWGECEYLAGRLARSTPERPAVQRRYADDALRVLETHILPTLGGKRLDAITPGDCERLLFAWADAGAAPKSVNNWASIARVMFGEAYRLQLLQENPWDRVPPFATAGKPRDCLTVEEARLLLNPATIGTIWNGHHLYYAVSLLAAVTGARQGEILGLRHEDVFPDHLQIDASYSIRYQKRGPTKTKVKAPVPLPRFAWGQLAPYREWEGYVFSFNGGRSPATGNRCTGAFYSALEKIGVTPAERRARNIVFHSWRRWCNTYLRSKGVPDSKVRAVTRHATEQMTRHYTSYHLEDYREVTAALEDFTGTLDGGK